MTTKIYNDWQFKQKDCTCEIHRYHVAHLCACRKLISHSQGDFNAHKFHGGVLDVNPFWIKHGDTVEDILQRYLGMGFFMRGLEKEESKEVYFTLTQG